MQFQGEEVSSFPGQGQPFKIMDYSKEHRFGIVATDLKDLINKACAKLKIAPDTPVRVALAQDGTEVEDEDYFSTLEKNTELMILANGKKWLPAGKCPKYRIVVDEPDGDGTPPKHLQNLVDRLHSDLTSITLLGGKELELLADMDPDSIADFFPGDNRVFLESLKEASSRFLAEKQQARDAMDLLKLYHCHHVTPESSEKKTV
ncbi:hypothetical protein RUM43_013912 [Polyplax serrata]|uniref:CIDE-N domain-containing protein n=1 Tax=Polyplax serrata TaxID=468196 RepID=A0AAN8PIT5_POLSC